MLLFSLPVTLICVAAYTLAPAQWLISSGPMTPGHENLRCSSCHVASAGTVRQQVQAKLGHLVGTRTHDVQFGYLPVASNTCLACHERPNERHPIHRFNEPRFREAVSRIDARSCLTCHREHQGSRVTTAPEFCVACHDGLRLKNDPLDVPHHELVARDAWNGCLGCHDFHGNHPRKTQVTVAEGHLLEDLIDYFKDGAQIYGTRKIHPAKETLP